MRGIILAAGKGRRLESVLPGQPKCLLKFGEKTLIEHQIAALAGAGIRDLVIVVGYEQEQIRTHLKDVDANITYMENPIYDRTNTLYSLWLTREFFDDSFIYFNADVLFDYRIIQALLKGNDISNFACIKDQCGEEEVKVVVLDNRIVEIGKHMAAERCFGEFIGIARFDKKDNIRFKEILCERAKDESNWNKFFEFAVDDLSKEAMLNVVDISELPATEIDFPEDLEHARNHVYPLLAKSS